MLETFKYINHLNEVIEFGKNGIYVNYNTLRDYSWDITSANNKIASFKKGIVSKPIPIIIKCNSEEEGIEIRNRLFEVFEKDVLAKKNGRIVVGEYYLKCYITGSKKSNYLIDKGYMHLSLTMKTDYPAWIKESYTIFRPKSALNTSESAEGREILIGNATNSILTNYAVYGRSEQKSYKGINLIDLSTFSSSFNITNYSFDNETGLMSFDFDGIYANPSFECTYLAGETVYAYLRNITNTNAELGTEYCYMQFVCTLSDGTTTYTRITNSGATLPADATYIRLGIYGNNAGTSRAGSLSANVMISSEPSETYEKFVGGEASPNPSYPQDIKSVGDVANLIPKFEGLSILISGLSITNNDDKSVTLDGSYNPPSMSGGIIPTQTTHSIASVDAGAGDYILESGVYLPSGLTMDAYYEDGTSEGIKEGERTAIIHCTSKIVEIKITAQRGKSFDKFTFYPKLYRGLGVNTNNKNLLNHTATSTTLYGVTFTLNSDGSIIANGTATGRIGFTLKTIPDLPDEDLILSGCPSGGDNLTYSMHYTNYVDFAYVDKGEGVRISKFDYVKYPNARIHIDIRSGTVCNNLVFKPMIRLASIEDDSYVPYQSTKALIPLTDSLRGIKVTEGGNYTDETGQQWVCDTLQKYADGSGKLIQRIYHKVFDGTQYFTVSSATTRSNYFIYTNNSIALSTKGKCAGALCTRLSEIDADYLWVNDVEKFAIDYQTHSIRMRFADITDVDTLNAQLKEWYDNGEPLEFICERAGYIETPLTAEQVAEIEKLQTFEGITYITNKDDAYQEVTYSIMQYLDFPYGYEYDFTADFDSDELLNTSFVPVDFRMVFHGAVANPSVYIAGHEYSVDVTVEDGDYLTIDSQAKTIVLSKRDGTQVNCFNNRNRDSYVFEKIPSGRNEITSANDLNIDITLLDERSEPKWT